MQHSVQCSMCLCAVGPDLLDGVQGELGALVAQLIDAVGMGDGPLGKA